MCHVDAGMVMVWYGTVFVVWYGGMAWYHTSFGCTSIVCTPMIFTIAL